MPWIINDKEFESVSALPLQKRYDYFIERVADSAVVWSLGGDNGWVLMGDDKGREVVPVWPHERYAAACVSGEWKDSEPRPISLEDWMNGWLPGIAKDQRLAVIFRTPMSNGAVVTPEQLKTDLVAELRNYE
jgi:hypothetical protein